MDTITKETTKIKKTEILGLSVAGFGQNLIFGFWSSYMMIFHTDILGISAAAAGIIAMATRIFDAVNDSMSGMLIDRTKSRWGRYRPWFMLGALPIAILFVLSFASPQLNMGLKIAYAAVTYVLTSTFFDFVDVPFWTMPSAMTLDAKKRGNVFVIMRVATTFGSLIVGIIAVPLIKIFGGTDVLTSKGFIITAIVLASTGVLCYLTGFFLVREHVEAPKQENFSVKTIVKAVFQNKPLLLIIASFILINTATQIRVAMNLYFTGTNLGDIGKTSMLGLVTVPGMLIGMGFTPLLMKHFDAKKIYIWACVAGSVLHLAFFLVGYTNYGVVLAFTAVLTIPIGIGSILVSTLISMTIEYSELKTGKRNEALISSTQTFTSKICMAIAAGVTALVLIISGYSATKPATDFIKNNFMFTVSVVPAILFALAIIPVLSFEITTKRHKEIIAEIENRKALPTSQD